MNTNGSRTAFPTTEEANEAGLTKREYFAAMAMQGLLARATTVGKVNLIVDDAVTLADELIKELNKETTR